MVQPIQQNYRQWLIGLNDLDSELPVINEDGKNPLENAEIKARA